jgi:hypothetical protein
MKNSAFIRLSGESDSNYVDIYTSYGVSFVKGSYLTLLVKSASKGYVGNDSRLENGIRVVAKPSYAKFKEKKMSLTILLEASSRSDFSSKLENFTAKISQGLFFLKIPSKARVFKLVYNDIKPKQEFRDFKATFTLDLTEPNPADRVTIT